MDRITKSLITELLSNFEISSEGESKDFEKLVNYVIVSNEFNKTFNFESVSIGSGNDTGIDGIAIIVNGQFVESIEEVKDLIVKNNFLEVEYIFTQAKTSSSFDGSDINTFLFGVSDFFSEDPKLVRNTDIQNYAEISNFIIDNAPLLRDNPKLKLFYVTTGMWNNDTNLQGIIETGELTLKNTNLFDKILFKPMGARELASAYRKTKDAVSCTVIFNNRITIPPIKGVSEAYIGLLPFNEFLKIVSNDDGTLLNVFEDNVRDFQGYDNDVNGGIESTLTTNDSEIFSVLNNGITIVASSISTTGDKFTFTDYQIVNGCQTSNVLFNNKKSEYINDVSIPIKLIATIDDEVKTRITLATNNQTPIKKEQLAALTKFQKGLELFYNSFEGDAKLFYERRAKQYATDTHVIKSKIITLQYQIKTFAAMFLSEPHNVTSFYGTIVKKMNDGKIRIFDNEHSFLPYYTSAYAYYKLESFFKKGVIDTSYKKVRFHILLLFRLLNESEKNLSFKKTKKMDKYCEHLLSILNNNKKALKAFKACIEIIDKSGFDKTDKQEIKLASKTKLLIEYIGNK